MKNSYQNSTIAQILEAIINELPFDISNSNIADILLSILNKTEYNKETKSVIAELLVKLKAKLEGEPYDAFDGISTSRIADILISILDETEYSDEPQSRIAELLLELKEKIEEDFTELTASGAIASFETNVSKPLVSLVAYIKANQESGTPSPQNPLPISGVSEVSIYHSDDDTTNPETKTIELGQTIFGGQVIVDKAGKTKLRVTHGIANFNELAWNRSNNGGAWQSYLFYVQISDKVNGGILKCSNYEYVVQATTSVQNEKIISVGSSKYIYVRDDAYTTVADFKTANANTQLVYSLAEPIIIDLPDTEQIVAYEGANNIWNDSSDTEVTYLYKGQPETVNLLSSHNFGGLLGMDTGNDETANLEDDAESLQIDTDNDIME